MLAITASAFCVIGFVGGFENHDLTFMQFVVCEVINAIILYIGLKIYVFFFGLEL